jgi:hypothetical protein
MWTRACRSAAHARHAHATLRLAVQQRAYVMAMDRDDGVASERRLCKLRLCLCDQL